MLFDQLVTPVIETHAVGLSNSAPNPTRSALRPRSPRCQSEAIAVGDDVGEEFSSMAAPSAEEFRTRYPRTPLTCSEFKLLASC